VRARDKEAAMSQEEYRDSDFNMRAIFYQQTVKDGQKKKGKKTDRHTGYVEKVRRNVRLHQKPLTKNR
jgi:hypothetical protein